MRIEIETALQRDIPVIPVLFGEAELPEANELPKGLRGLTKRHALNVRDSSFQADINNLLTEAKSLPNTKTIYNYFAEGASFIFGLAFGIFTALFLVVQADRFDSMFDSHFTRDLVFSSMFFSVGGIVLVILAVYRWKLARRPFLASWLFARLLVYGVFGFITLFRPK